jgi:hypothetical protein
LELGEDAVMSPDDVPGVAPVAAELFIPLVGAMVDPLPLVLVAMLPLVEPGIWPVTPVLFIPAVGAWPPAGVWANATPPIRMRAEPVIRNLRIALSFLRSRRIA